jgi:hypothetical protein
MSQMHFSSTNVTKSHFHLPILMIQESIIRSLTQEETTLSIQEVSHHQGQNRICTSAIISHDTTIPLSYFSFFLNHQRLINEYVL